MGALPGSGGGRIPVGIEVPAWRLTSERGSADELHGISAEALKAAPDRLARALHVTRPALVLGGHQEGSPFDPGGGWDVARRPSGGSAVLVGGNRVVWVDFLLRRGDPLWDDDVRRAGWWVGDLWASVLAKCGVGELAVWRDGLRSSDWSGWWCFAGIGPGEVTAGGRKVVGVSQRRTAKAALFQTAVLVEWDPAEHLRLLKPLTALPDESFLAECARGIGERTGAHLLTTLRSELGDMIL